MRLKLTDLNPPQREAVTHGDGPLLVLAGAGSGKTRVIVYRIAHLIQSGVSPSAIVAVSFTNKAAEEMRERVKGLVGRAPGLKVCTFHALGLRILDAERDAFSWRQRPVLYDTADQLRVLGEALRSMNLSGVSTRRQDLMRIHSVISRWKNASLTPEEVTGGSPSGPSKGARKARLIVNETDELAALCFPKYEEALKAFAAVDFDDLISRPTRLLEADTERREGYQRRWRYLLVDEYQDTNAAQLRLLRCLAGFRMNLTVVGDDDQSIYGWRGAKHDNILAFDRDFPGARMVVLDENYRSTQSVLDAANALVEKNRSRKKKRLWTRGGQGDRPKAVACPDPAEEARYVAEEIRALKDRHAYTLGDFAILFRTNMQSRPLEEALRELQVPYIVIGGMAFFDRKEVKDLLAYLRLCINPRDEISLRRVINYPPRGVGLTTLEKLDGVAEDERVGLFEACRRAADGKVASIGGKGRDGLTAFVSLIDRYSQRFAQGGLGDPATELVAELQLREDIIKSADDVVVGHRKADNVDDLLESMQRYARRKLAERDQAAADLAAAPAGAAADALAEEPVEDPALSLLETWLASITLQAADDREKDADQDRVCLMTLHAAKGLEFKNVFLVGCEEDLLPHSRSLPEGGGKGADSFDEEEGDGERTRNSALGVQGAAQMLEEERRLCYVGMTRARERLYLTHCKLRRKHREEFLRMPSRFLKEVPDELIDRIDLDAPPPMDEKEEQEFGAAALAEIWKKLK